MSINELKNEKAVYIIIDKNRSDEENIVYKIGYSNKVKSRVEKIKSTYKFLGQDGDLEVLTVIYCNQPRKMERHLHLMLSHYRLIDKHEFFKSTLEKLNSKLLLLKLADYK